MYKYQKCIATSKGFGTTHYDNAKNVQDSSFSWLCPLCNHGNHVDLKLVLDGYLYEKEEDLDAELLVLAEEIFAVKLFMSSPCNGWSYFLKRFCENCSGIFLLWVGINEVINSHYLISVHGVYEVKKL